MTNKLKVGIACDNYKVKYFKKALKAKGFEFNILENTPVMGTSTFKIKTSESRVRELHALCKQVEIEAKQSN